ncbi:uronyl 2-sulfotransferase-like [Antedon mediterranea]|uniref:uronyl 2-sulfotransferase-like n=1 Tax=Antedon mediterranea TaxID=105859 RepID=UPI003AF9C793
MANKKILITLFLITGVLIICYVYVGSNGSLSYGEGTSSASGVLSIAGKHKVGPKKKPITSRKPKLEWKEYWKHIEERKIMGFQDEGKNVFEETNKVSQNKSTEVVGNVVNENKKVVEPPVNTILSKPDKVIVGKKKWLYDWNETKEGVEKLPLYGNWEDTTAQRIIFNRVGKCGSRSVLDVFKHLAKVNKYNMINSVIYNQTRTSEEKKNLLVSVLLKVDPPFLFQRHLHYIDFTKFSSSYVKYINIVRDPIERFTSQYYFRRFGDGKNDKSTRPFKGTEEEKYQTINECVLRKKFECSRNKLQYIIPFFCGQSPQCRFQDRTPLEIAKKNVERDFIVVGILDELENTFAVLEKMLPRFFAGAVDYMRAPGNTYSRNRSSTMTNYKESPSPEVHAVLMQQMSLEYEFYHFIKERFEQLKSQLGIGTTK